jgi:RimJ/RimL family protein N-acetyltransferase
MDPSQYEAAGTLRDGATVRIRAIRPGDRGALIEGFSHLSDRSIYQRFFQAKHELTETELKYLTELDFTAHIGLVAVIPSDTPEGRPIGVGRFVRGKNPSHAEVAFVVGDQFQGRGVGTLLLEHLARIGRAIGIEAFEADVLPDNTQMLEVFQHSGLSIEERVREGVVHVRLDL